MPPRFAASISLHFHFSLIFDIFRHYAAFNSDIDASMISFDYFHFRRRRHFRCFSFSRLFDYADYAAAIDDYFLRFSIFADIADTTPDYFTLPG